MQYYAYQQRVYAPRERVTWAVRFLILANCIVFFVQLAIDIALGGAVQYVSFMVPGGLVSFLLAFQPDHLLWGWVWQPFTYMFLHSGVLHLFLNMLWLFFFGPEVERALGTRQFFKFYIVCGALGVLATYFKFLFPGEAAAVSVVGASGAVMGVLAAHAVINPERQFFMFPLPIPINTRALVIIVIVMQVISAVGGTGGNTSVATHLGGIFVGFAYMKIMPVWRRWRLSVHSAKSEKDPLGKVGEAVDNIFKFRNKQ